MSRRARVESLLRRGGVCALDDFYLTRHSNDRNELAGLRRAGWHFTSDTGKHGCRSEDEPVHAHYRLIHGPERRCVGCGERAPKQMELIAS